MHINLKFLSTIKITLATIIICYSVTPALSQTTATCSSLNSSTSSIIDYPDDSANYDNQCLLSPLFIKVMFYEIGICKKQPSLLTYGTAEAECVPIYKNASGIEVDIVNDGSVTKLNDGKLSAEEGVYEYQYAELSSQIKFAAKAQFAQDKLGKTSIGKYCWSLDSSGNDEFWSNRNVYDIECGSAFPSQIGTITSDLSNKILVQTTRIVQTQSGNWLAEQIYLTSSGQQATITGTSPSRSNAYLSDGTKMLLMAKDTNNSVNIIGGVKGLDLKFLVSNAISVNMAGSIQHSSVCGSTACARTFSLENPTLYITTY